MTTSVLDRIPVDEITARAKAVRPRRAVLTLIAAVLFGLGFGVAKSAAVVFLAAAWTWAAFRVGFEAAHGPTRGQKIAGLEAEVNALKMANARLGG